MEFSIQVVDKSSVQKSSDVIYHVVSVVPSVNDYLSEIRKSIRDAESLREPEKTWTSGDLSSFGIDTGEGEVVSKFTIEEAAEKDYYTDDRVDFVTNESDCVGSFLYNHGVLSMYGSKEKVKLLLHEFKKMFEEGEFNTILLACVSSEKLNEPNFLVDFKQQQNESTEDFNKFLYFEPELNL